MKRWQCPVCLNYAGDVDGVVPCVLPACRPSPHLLCIDCLRALPEPLQCPKCRAPIASRTPLPLTDLLADDDRAAYAKVPVASSSSSSKIDRKRKRAVDSLASVYEAAHEKFDTRQRELRDKRLDMVLNAIADRVGDGSVKPGSLTVVQIARTPTFENDNGVSVVWRSFTMSRATKARTLNTMYETLREPLDTLFQYSPFTVRLLDEPTCASKSNFQNSIDVKVVRFIAHRDHVDQRLECEQLYDGSIRWAIHRRYARLVTNEYTYVHLLIEKWLLPPPPSSLSLRFRTPSVLCTGTVATWSHSETLGTWSCCCATLDSHRFSSSATTRAASAI